jgi:hypothetical protein
MPKEETKKIKVQSRGGKNICKPVKKKNRNCCWRETVVIPAFAYRVKSSQ